MNSIWAIVFTIFIIVFVHELGHFLFARLFGVTVERFSIGFPPVLYRKKIKGTEYSIGLIPLGGYVKMKGILDESMDESSITGAPDEFASKKTYQKILILAGGVLFNLIFAYLIFTGITYTNGKIIIPGTTIGVVDSNSIGFQAGLRVDDRIVAINDTKVSNWDEISETFLKNIGNNIAIKIYRNDSLRTLMIPASMFQEKKSEYLGVGPKIYPVIGQVQPGSPAEKARIMVNDTIIAFNGYPVETWYQLTDSIQNYPEKEISLTIKRASGIVTLKAIPRSIMIEQKDKPAKEVGQLGISVKFDRKSYSFLQSMHQGVLEIEKQFLMNFKGFYLLFTGARSPREMIGGPLVIAKLASTAASYGWSTLLQFIAALNIILVIFNILPIPALDGGHILLVVIEAIRRKPISLQTRMRIQQIGFVILLLIFIFAIFNDLTR